MGAGWPFLGLTAILLRIFVVTTVNAKTRIRFDCAFRASPKMTALKPGGQFVLLRAGRFLCYSFAEDLEFVLAAADGSHDDDGLAVVEHYPVTWLKLFEPWRGSWYKVIAGAGVPKQHYGDILHGMHPLKMSFLPQDLGRATMTPSIAVKRDEFTVMAGCNFVCKKLLVNSRSVVFQ